MAGNWGVQDAQGRWLGADAARKMTLIRNHAEAGVYRYPSITVAMTAAKQAMGIRDGVALTAVRFPK